MSELSDDLIDNQPSDALLRKAAEVFAAVFDEKGYDIGDIGKVFLQESITKLDIGGYQSLIKNADEEAEIHDLSRFGISFAPSWDTGPRWPLIQPAPGPRVQVPKPEAKSEDGWYRAIAYPDIQFGYYRGSDNELHGFSDEAALDVALQITKVVKPHTVIMHGDNIDFADLTTKFKRHPRFQGVTQKSIDRATYWLDQVTKAAGSQLTERFWLEGNHEKRLPNYIIDYAMAAWDLQPSKVPENWDPKIPIHQAIDGLTQNRPSLTVSELCLLDQRGWNYVSGYPANDVWLNDNLRIIHGDKVSRATVDQYLAEERATTLYGHIHRREYREVTRHTRKGPRTVGAGSAGCLCRIDGVVPSTKSGIDEMGDPVYRVENWQQGLWVIEYQIGGDQLVSCYDVPIYKTGDKTWARWQGRDFVARVGVEDDPI